MKSRVLNCLAKILPDVKFEIGHVLFIDIVGYSKLLINEQSEQIQKLKRNRPRNGAVPLSPKPKASCCVCPRAMVEHWCFELRRKRRSCAHSRSAKN